MFNSPHPNLLPLEKEQVPRSPYGTKVKYGVSTHWFPVLRKLHTGYDLMNKMMGFAKRRSTHPTQFIENNYPQGNV